jgi:hypothetical protein
MSPLMLLNVKDLAYILDMPIWADGTPNEVMQGKKEDRELHRQRVAEADINIPIIISRFVLEGVWEYYWRIKVKGGRYDVLDGIHRLYKQVDMGRQFILVVVATKEEIESARAYSL